MELVVAFAPLLFVFGAQLVAWVTIKRNDEELLPDAVPGGRTVAERTLARHRIKGVSVTEGDSDYYAPTERHIALDWQRIGRRSPASAAIAAHEAAHAVQHARRLRVFQLRYALWAPALLASVAWLPLAIAAVVLSSRPLAYAAVAAFSAAVVAALMTLWIEVDASRRAMKELREIAGANFDFKGARRVLIACGATYVAESVADFAWFVRRIRGSDRPGSEGPFESLFGGWL